MSLSISFRLLCKIHASNLIVRFCVLTALELDNYVTLGDVTGIFYLFEVLMSHQLIRSMPVFRLGSEGKTTICSTRNIWAASMRPIT